MDPEEPTRSRSEWSAAILAGGRSTRMGRNKALVTLAGVRLIDRARHIASQISDDVILVTRDSKVFSDFKGRVVEDHLPNRGPLCGIETALGHARHPHMFAMAVDSPFIEPDLVSYLAGFAPHYDAVYCMGPERAEPLIGFYCYSCSTALRQMQAEGVWQLFRLPNYANVRIVPYAEALKFDPQGISFFNINTPEDLKRAELLLHTRRWGRA